MRLAYSATLSALPFYHAIDDKARHRFWYGIRSYCSICQNESVVQIYVSSKAYLDLCQQNCNLLECSLFPLVQHKPG